MQMHFKKCTLLLKPEQACFAYKTVVFRLPHPYAQITTVYLTFFEAFYHQGLLGKGHNTLHDGEWPCWHSGGWLWWLYVSWSSTVPNQFFLMYFHLIKWCPFTHLTRKETTGIILTPVSSLPTPKSCCAYPHLLISLVQDIKISHLNDIGAFQTGFPHSSYNTYTWQISACILTRYPCTYWAQGRVGSVSYSCPSHPNLHFSLSWERVLFPPASYRPVEYKLRPCPKASVTGFCEV